MHRVDVIMATYNGEKYLKEQVNSVLLNRGCDVYLHVFDDGSSDRTLEILRQLENEYANHLFLYQNEHNLGVTRNFLHGIQQVMEHFYDARYFMCCDQDDVWNPDKIFRTLKRMHQMENRFSIERPMLVFSDAVVTDESLNEVAASFYKSQHLNVSKTDLPHLLMENKCIGCTIMINRAFEPYLFQKPEKAKYHDWWLALIAASFGNISFLPKRTLKYRQHTRNVVGGSKFDVYVGNRLKNRKKIKARLIENKLQAEEFLLMFEDGLSLHKKRILESFIGVYEQKWLKKRYVLLHQGFLKSGIIRNIGLMLFF